LTYHIETEDLYQDFYNDKHLFNFSDFPKNNQFHGDENKKVIGKMKMEEINTPISEFIGLRSKMYSILYDHGVSKKTAKGVQSSVKNNEITHSDYSVTLNDKTRLYLEQRSIRAYNHELFSIRQNKISLSCYDDKRYLLDDGITSYAYGNHNISLI
jgi:hypothetical protein